MGGGGLIQIKMFRKEKKNSPKILNYQISLVCQLWPTHTVLTLVSALNFSFFEIPTMASKWLSGNDDRFTTK